MMNILVINSGSSSIKYGLFEMPKGRELASGLVEKIGDSGSRVVHRDRAPPRLPLRGHLCAPQPRPGSDQSSMQQGSAVVDIRILVRRAMGCARGKIAPAARPARL